MKRLLLALASVGLLAAGTSAAASKDDAFQIDKRSFKKNIKTVALAPVDADGYLEMPERVGDIIEQEITARLQKRGFTVIPGSVLGGIRKTMEEQVGGPTDLETGALDRRKAQAVRDHAFRELWFRQQFDALILVRVSITQVKMENDTVEWDGAKQKLAHEGRGRKYSASVAVSSITVAMYDSTNKPIYQYYGGLEPLMYRDGEQLQPLPADKFFRDEKKIRKAAQIAVSPL